MGGRPSVSAPWGDRQSAGAVHPYPVLRDRPERPPAFSPCRSGRSGPIRVGARRAFPPCYPSAGAGVGLPRVGFAAVSIPDGRVSGGSRSAHAAGGASGEPEWARPLWGDWRRLGQSWPAAPVASLGLLREGPTGGDGSRPTRRRRPTPPRRARSLSPRRRGRSPRTALAQVADSPHWGTPTRRPSRSPPRCYAHPAPVTLAAPFLPAVPLPHPGWWFSQTRPPTSQPGLLGGLPPVEGRVGVAGRPPPRGLRGPGAKSEGPPPGLVAPSPAGPPR